MRRCLFTALLLLPLLLPASSVMGDPPATWPELSDWSAWPPRDGRQDAALLVAVERYQELQEVEGAHDNLRDWERFLGGAMGIPAGNILTAEDKDVTPAILRGRADRAAEKVGKGGVLWFLFIGHGATRTDSGPPRTDTSVLLGYAAGRTAETLVDPAYSVDRDELIARMRRGVPRDAHLLAIVDACFSGEDPDGEALAPGYQVGSYRADTPALQDRETLLLATSPGQVAGRLPGARRPAFSYLLLGGLRGWADDRSIHAGADRDSKVTPEEALGFAEAVLTSLGAGQEPSLQGIASPVRLSASLGGRLDLAAIKEGLGRGQRPREEGYDYLMGLADARAEARGQADRRRSEDRERALVAERALAAEAFDKVRSIYERDRETGVRAAGHWLKDWADARVTLPTVRIGLEGFPAEEPEVRPAETLSVDAPELVQVREMIEGPSPDADVSEGGAAKSRDPAEETRTADGPASALAPDGRAVVVNPGRGWRESQMVEVPAGKFLYGCRSISGRDETRCSDDEVSPAVQRRTGRFWIDRTEVTVERYIGCVAEGKCPASSFDVAVGLRETCNAAVGGKPARPDHPMNCVDWRGAVSFCRAVGG